VVVLLALVFLVSFVGLLIGIRVAVDGMQARVRAQRP
jgi:hypothetical protein